VLPIAPDPSLESSIEAPEGSSRKRHFPPDDLLITLIPHGDELQAEFNRAFESKGRKASTHFENVLQKEAYIACAEILDGKFILAVQDALSRGRESRRDLLATLKAWCRNEKRDCQSGQSDDIHPHGYGYMKQALAELRANNGK
jgi:hypothetical protein